MRTTLQKYIGHGLYTVPEAARYARVDPALVRRWLFGTSKLEPVFTPQFGRDERLISFLDLIQTLAIRQIRVMNKVPVKKIRQAMKWVKVHLNEDYPFARKHFTYLFGSELAIEFKKGQYAEVSGKHIGQGLIREIVEPYLVDLTYDDSGLARAYTIYRSRDQVKVIMDPEIRFGEAVLPSGYSARCLYEAIETEGSVRNAAKAYGVDEKEITAAFGFFDYLSGTTAA